MTLCLLLLKGEALTAQRERGDILISHATGPKARRSHMLHRYSRE